MNPLNSAYSFIRKQKRARQLKQIRQTHGGDRMVFDLPCGMKISLRYEDSVAQRLLLTRFFEPEASAVIFALVRPDMTVLDIGANIGVHALHMASLVGACGRVIAFEPNPTAYRELCDNVILNKLTNVQPQCLALWREDADRTFYLPPDGQESMGGLSPNGRFVVADETMVRTARLDRYLQHLGVERIDFIKIDVEGAELPILEGAGDYLSGSSRPAVFFEAFLPNSIQFGYAPEDLVDFLCKRGYAVAQIDHANYLAIPHG